MNQILSLSLAVIVQVPTSGPPVPKMGPAPPPPPVGDVPLDGNIWVLFVAAIVLGVAFYYRNRQKAL